MQNPIENVPVTTHLVAISLERMTPYNQLQGVYFNKPNRPLTNDDVAGAQNILICVNADSHYSLCVQANKADFADINTDNTHRVTFWHFQWDDEQDGWVETLSNPPEGKPYNIVIGSVPSICHIANADDLTQAEQFLKA